MQHIALFGTSADPPNIGHREILRWLCQHFDWVAVWASDNPFKSHQTPLDRRERMLEMVIEELKSEPYRNIGLHSELSHSRTLKSIYQAKKNWEEDILTLVIGSDLAAQLPQWYRIEEVLQHVSLLIMPRPGYPLADITLEKLNRMTKVTIADREMPDTSSTEYRQTHNRDLLTPIIRDYIDREKLYGVSSNDRSRSIGSF